MCACVRLPVCVYALWLGVHGHVCVCVCVSVGVQREGNERKTEEVKRLEAKIEQMTAQFEGTASQEVKALNVSAMACL